MVDPSIGKGRVGELACKELNSLHKHLKEQDKSRWKRSVNALDEEFGNVIEGSSNGGRN
ncbi:hypothetical protein ACS0TY_015520 [Phlomoides rotata]